MLSSRRANIYSRVVVFRKILSYNEYVNPSI